MSDFTQASAREAAEYQLLCDLQAARGSDYRAWIPSQRVRLVVSTARLRTSLSWKLRAVMWLLETVGLA